MNHKTIYWLGLLSFTVHAFGPIANDPDLPPPKQIGAPTILAYQIPGQPAKVVLEDGTTITKDLAGNPITHPLAIAMKKAKPGDVIGLKGIFKGVTIGKTDPNKATAVYWPNGAIIRDVSITSIDYDDPATIDGITLMGNTLVPGAGGVDELLFQRVKFRNAGGSTAPFIIAMKNQVGMIRLYDIAFVPWDFIGYSGYGMKWNIRAQGRARYDLRGVKFAMAQEHGLYLDSIGADGLGDSYFLDLTQRGKSGRTGIQIVNRKDPAMGGGPTGLGNIYLRRLKLWTEAGGGGSGLTVVGHLGNIYVDDVYYRGSLGAIVFWSDAGKGLHLTPDGFTCPYVELRNIRVNSPTADRSHIAIAGVREVVIGDFLVEGNKAAFDFNSPYGGPIDNGSVDFEVPGPLSQYPGFQSAQKIRLDGAKLTDSQIDSLWP